MVCHAAKGQAQQGERQGKPQAGDQADLQVRNAELLFDGLNQDR